MNTPFPKDATGRTRWILAQRPDLDAVRRRLAVDPPVEWLIESEPDGQGQLAEVLTVFLTNRECPWRCLMCDLWRHTTLESVSSGFIPAQMDRAFTAAHPSSRSNEPRWIKLYNAGSFFDPRAIPPEDHPAILERCAGFQRVIVECHPMLVGEAVERFRDSLPGGCQLEVAMGLEVADPDVLEKLNKGITLERYAAAAQRLNRMGIESRSFVLIQPPFVVEERAADLAVESVDFAMEQGASVVSLIPTRPGNGALDRLLTEGVFRPPTPGIIESAFKRSLALGKGRVFLDLWGLEQFWGTNEAVHAARARLHEINLSQRWSP